MAEPSPALTPWQLDKLRQAHRLRSVGGLVVDFQTRGHRGLVDAGLAYWSGDRLNVTQAGRKALERAGEVERG